MRIHDSVAVNAPREHVFAILADPRRVAALHRDTGAALVQVAGDGPQTGARFRLSGSSGTPWQFDYTEVDPPKLITAEYGPEGSEIAGRTTYRLEAIGSATRVTIDAETRMGWVAETICTILGPLYSWLVSRGHRTLAQKIESAYQSMPADPVDASSSDIRRR